MQSISFIVIVVSEMLVSYSSNSISFGTSIMDNTHDNSIFGSNAIYYKLIPFVLLVAIEKIHLTSTVFVVIVLIIAVVDSYFQK